MNMISVTGNLGKDPDTRYSAEGKARSLFSVGSNGWGKDAATTWFNCVAFGRTAELAQQHLSKGSKVTVHGRLQTRTYVKDGEEKKITELVVSEIGFHEKKAPTAESGEDDFNNFDFG